MENIETARRLGASGVILFSYDSLVQPPRGAGHAGQHRARRVHALTLMSYLDLTIIAAYLAGTVLFGAWFTRRQRDLKYYFVSDRNLPWWVVMASIVSTETSAVTFISVPGYAFSTDFTFLQLPLGYVVGRFVVSLLFVPAYFRGEVLTVYQLLGDRFGGAVKQLASGLFLVTRTLSDGFRLFATSLVLGALFLALPGSDDVARAWLPAPIRRWGCSWPRSSCWASR